MDETPDTGHAYFGGLARRVRLPRHVDARGTLAPFDFAGLPFVPRRAFVVSGVPAGTVRGGHGHRTGSQLLVCIGGRIEVLMRHQDAEATLVLDPASPALVFGPGVWCRQRYLAEGSLLLVFASEPYDPGSYLTDASSFAP